MRCKRLRKQYLRALVTCCGLYKVLGEDAIVPKQPGASLTYADAGVDIDAAARLVDRIEPLARATARPGSEASLGGFGGLFDLKAAGFTDPLLVAGTDGVGTKLKIAFETGIHDTVGIDLVAMCVNDVVVQGAEPLLFLDYFAVGHLDTEVTEAVIGGIAAGCQTAGCALIGGETAEMPGMYPEGEYDLGGFALGAVERDALLTGTSARAGDVVLGLASNGLHANGYSLVRHLVGQRDFDLAAPAPFENDQTLGAALLEPTRIYVRSCLAALRTGGVSALAHVTGGGLVNNLARTLPTELGIALVRGSWPELPVFSWIREAGQVSEEEMIRTFNMGIGMTAVTPADAANQVIKAFEEAGETVFRIGTVTAGQATDARVAFGR